MEEHQRKLTSPAHSVVRASIAAFVAPYTKGRTKIFEAIEPMLHAATFRHSTYANNSLCHINHAEDVDGEFIFELLFFHL